MKMYKLLALVLTAALLLSLAACGRQATPTTTTVAPTTGSAGTTNPSETTVPPTTEEPHVELTREVIFQMLDEATVLLNENEMIMLKTNEYTEQFVDSMDLGATGAVSLSDGVITVQNAKNSPVFDELRFLILLTTLMEQYPDAYAEDNISGNHLPFVIYQITFYSEYAAAGYDSVSTFISDNYSSQLPGTSRFCVGYDGYFRIEELPRYFKGETNRQGNFTLYYDRDNAEYYKYLQSKGEG